MKVVLQKVDLRSQQEVDGAIAETEALLDFLQKAKVFAASANGKCEPNGQAHAAAAKARAAVAALNKANQVRRERIRLRRQRVARCLAGGPQKTKRIIKDCGLKNDWMLYAAVKNHPWFQRIGFGKNTAYALTALGRKEAL